MPLFKDTVALEASPAKTAESLSYGITFAVLGWLLLSNYSVIGFAGTPETEIAVAELSAGENAGNSTGISTDESAAATGLSPTPANQALARHTASSGQMLLSNAENTIESSPAAGIEMTSYPALADLTAWHSKLQQTERPAHQHDFRKFPVATGGSVSATMTQPTEPLLEGLKLPLPLIDSKLLLLPTAGSELASLNADEPNSLHEITVTGREPERLNSRPDNIRRPQLPRPYRAQEVQRSLLLPPRIQALRP